MYIILILVLLAMGAALVMKGNSARRRGWIAAGASILAGTILFFAFLSFWGEYLWFVELGYTSRFWTAVLAKVGFGLLGAGVGALVVYLLTLPIQSRLLRGVSVLLGSVIGAVGGAGSWSVILRYIHAVPTELRDPIFGRDEGFYLFALPFYDVVYALLLLLTFVAIIAAVIAALLAPASKSAAPIAWSEDARAVGDDGEQAALPPLSTAPAWSGWAYRPLILALGGLALVLAWGRYLASFHLMYSRFGAVNGPGWTDVHVRLPGHYVVGALMLLVGLALVVPPVARALHRWSGAARAQSDREALLRTMLLPVAAVGLTWFVALGALPVLFQWLKVHPNEISLERPYLANSIAFTRRGFRLHEVEDTAFPVSDQLTRETIASHPDVLSEVRLWDPRAIDDVFQQFQAIRLYYDLSEVDVDRYVMGGRYRQVMAAPREMKPSNLPREHQTFVNQRFKYTHGHGLAMASVSEFKNDGLPNLLVQDIPPIAAFPELAVTRPEIYYGELTHGYVVGNTKEPEFDYPSGEENVYTRYAGTGGVPLQGFFRKFLFGWKLGGTAFLMSTYPTAESRVMFRREIRERVEAVAPFLELDRDPYMVVASGKLFWIVDMYTTSSYYPYSEPFFSSAHEDRQEGAWARASTYLGGKNYVRNSVKAVVDAFNGSVTLYVFEPDDPVVKVWSRAFPGLFRARSEMPEELSAHVRYPEDFLLAQGLVYTKYHMTDPEVFYNQEDLWVPATERSNNDIQPVDPYYIMWKPPGAREAEFTLMQPFTPRNRQVLISWIAGMCDGENYGRLLAYRFPKDKRVLGTQQMDAKIDQDPVLASRIALWSQQGSSVVRGNALVIPIGDTLLYVEPIFIRATTAAYPELRIVVVMHGDRMSYASTFDEALRGLLAGEARLPPGPDLGDHALGETLRRANQAFEGYLRLLGEKRFEDAARELETLSRTLQQSTETVLVPEME